MGLLHYDAVAAFEFDDRSLAHLRAAVLAKLNLQESLVLTWIDKTEGKQRTIWLSPSIPIQFEFESEQVPALNPEWIEQIMALATSSAGLRWIEEPKE